MDQNQDTSKSIHLSASAGSGKTRALKERYLALLEALEALGLSSDQAVAITFTDKAAAEIKERVMRDLPEPALKKIIRGGQDLRISTIHSFCMNLLKRYPLEAGLPPDFGVLDSRDQAYKLQSAVEDALEEGDRSPEIMAPLANFTADALVARIRFLLSIRSKLRRPEIDAGGPDALLRALHAGLEIEHLEKGRKELVSSPEWRSEFESMERHLRSQSGFYDECRAKEHLLLASAADPDAAARTAQSLVPVYMNKDGTACKKTYIAKSVYAGRDREAYERTFFRVQEMLETFLSLGSRIRSGREAIGLMKLFQIAEKRYQAAKLREGLLDFDDLEIYAYGLLQGIQSPEILYWLDRRILHFLVDEFQDTSDIQWSILERLTEEIFAGQGADKRMRPTLFVVGDEKQSIYRFREANYRIFETVRGKIEKALPPESRRILTLDRNFRSTPEVVDTVNRVFVRLWGKAYQPSVAERSRDKGSVRLLECAPQAKEQEASGRTEARLLARELRSFVENGTRVSVRRTAQQKAAESGESGLHDLPPAGNEWMERSAGYGDCAILIQSRTRLKEYEAALQEENIPYRVVGGIGFYEEDEIQALMNVLFFLWNRDDALALAAALKSPLFGLSDRAIFDLLDDNGSMIDRLRRQIPDQAALLHEWINLAGLVPLSTLLHRIINGSGAYIRFGKRNRQAVFNIDKLLDTAREFDRRGYTTLQDFVEWVKNIRQTEQREATADMNLSGFEGAVSIMTVHKAKGLEYPVVFLPGMNQQSKSLSTGPLAIVEDDHGKLRMAVKNADNPVYSELWEREHAELLREHQRLLYVAMTRARDHLIMLGSLNSGSKPVRQNTWLSYLHEAAPEPVFAAKTEPEPGVTAFSYGSPVKAEKQGPEEKREDGEQTREIDVEKVIENISPVPRSESPAWTKATDFIVQEEWVRKIYDQHQQLPVSPLVRGNVLHRCLEDFTKTGSYDAEAIADQHPETLALPSGIRRRFIEDVSKVMKEVLAAHAWVFEPREQTYSELPFLYRKGRTPVTGVIDRVVIRDGRGHVIDYKSILIESDEVLASWLNHYRPQIRIYTEAVKQIFGLPNVEGYLLFLDSNILARCSE